MENLAPSEGTGSWEKHRNCWIINLWYVPVPVLLESPKYEIARSIDGLCRKPVSSDAALASSVPARITFDEHFDLSEGLFPLASFFVVISQLDANRASHNFALGMR